MDLSRVPPSTIRLLAVFGALLIAAGGWLPQHVCWDDPACAVPWLSLAPAVLALAVVRRGWTPRVTVAFGLVAAAFWAAGLALVVTNAQSVVADALVGTGRSETLHRIGAAGYLYGGTLALAAFTLRTARRFPPGRRRPAAAVAALLALLPLLGLALVAVGRVDAVLAEALPEVVTVASVAVAGVAVAVTVADRASP